MPFRTFCNSEDKTCRKEIEPLIDKDTGKVYCPECELEVTIDPFMKNTLISMGQVLRESQEKTPYAVKCPECGKKKQPKLGPNREILCGSCGADITKSLSGPFVEMLRTAVSRK